MKKKGFATLVILLVSVFVIGITGGTVHGKAKYLIKLHQGEPIGSAVHEGAVKLKSLVEAQTNGEAEVTIYSVGEMGTDLEVAEMVQMGNINMAILATGWLGGIQPALQILDIPFLLPRDSLDAVDVLNGRAGEALGAEVGKKGLRVLAYYPLGVKQYTCNSPIRRPEDFKGLKIRTMASPLIVESFKVMGATPVALPYTEVYSALQLGTVVGEENPIWSIYKMKFYEVQEYVTLSYHAAFISMMTANPKWFDSLPQDIQKILADASKEIAYPIVERILREEKDELETIKASGTNIIELTPEDVQAFKDASMPVRAKYVEIVGESGARLLKAFEEEGSKAGN